MLMRLHKVNGAAQIEYLNVPLYTNTGTVDLKEAAELPNRFLQSLPGFSPYQRASHRGRHASEAMTLPTIHIGGTAAATPGHLTDLHGQLWPLAGWDSGLVGSNPGFQIRRKVRAVLLYGDIQGTPGGLRRFGKPSHF